VLETAYNQGQSGRVGEFMTRDLITVDADSSILDLAQKFRETPLRSFPVYKQGELVGVVSRTDVLKALISIK
ncbi:MAG: CBS domain-containing protein, partial [Methylicorpusculum sp.]|nr:CBS domain-containing protein [Methylicorpusculum sp.]